MILGSAALLTLCQVAEASVVFDIPNQSLIPNKADQSITVHVSADAGTPTMKGLNLYAELLPVGVSSAAPTFSGVSYTGFSKAPGSSDAFFGNASGDPVPPYTALADEFAFLTPTFVNGSTITFDVSTVGLSSGTYTLRLQDVLGDPTYSTSFVDSSASSTVFPVTTTGGTLTVAVPEPTSVMLLGAATVVMLGGRKRKAGAQAS
jgi:hypothetical protein